MDYYLSKKIEGISFDAAEKKVIELLKDQGFGIVTEINMTQTFKNKLGKDFRPYKILGACNPGYAYKALSQVDKVGVLLPCNVCVQQLDDSVIEVFTVNPLEAMQPIQDPEIEGFAKEVYDKLSAVVRAL